MKTVALILLSCLATPALAETPPVQAFGAAHPDCLDWTDGCTICTQKRCSTPGIACTPHEPVCEAQVDKPEPPKSEPSKPEPPKSEAPVAPPAEKP